MKDEDNANEIEERYKLITENMEDVIWTLDLKTGLFTYVSPSIYKLRGLTSEEVQNQTLQEALTGESFEYVNGFLSEQIAAFEKGDLTAKTKTIELAQSHKDGHIVFTEVAATLIKNQEGKVDKIIGVTRNITERKKTEEILRASEQRNRALVNAVPDLMFRVTRPGVFLDYKASSVDNLFVPPDFFLGKKIIEVLPEEISSLCLSELEKAFETNSLRTFEYQLSIGGVINFFEARVEPCDGENEAIYIIRDITEQKKTEIKFENERKTLRTLLETIPDMVWLKNPNGEYLFCNSVFELYTGLKEKDIIGKSDDDFESAERIPAIKKIDRAVLDGNKQIINIEELSFRGNSYKGLFETIRKPMYDSTGGLIGILGISRDISKLHNANSALRESEKSLKEAQHMAKIGSWIYDLKNDRLSWSDEVFLILGLDKKDFTVTYEAFLSAIHPDDRKMVNEAFATSLNYKTPYNIIHRILQKDGTVKYVSERCITEYSPTGIAVKSIGTIQDITEMKKAENEIREQEELYKNLVERLQEGIKIVTLDGKISWVNDKLVELYGCGNSADIMGKNHLDFIEDSQKEFVSGLFDKCLRDGKIDSYEINIKNPVKGIRIVELSAFLVKDEQGVPLYLVSVVKDITEQRKAEKMIKRLSIAIEQTEDTVFITDKNGTIEYVNNSLEYIYGYSRSELIGQNPKMFKSGIKDIDLYSNLWKTILNGEPFRAEFINKRKDGAYVFEDRNITPIKDEKGEITNFLSVGRDISERKYAEIKQAKNERRFSNILQTAIDGLIIFDAKGKIIEVNQAYITLSGYLRNELLQMHFADLVAPDNVQAHNKKLQGIIEMGRGQFESIHKKKDGSLFNVEASVMVSESDDVNIIAFIKDISERIRLFEDLAEAKEKAEEMNKLKSNFLANMSHELRTPLTGIIGYSEILFKSVEDPALREMADVIFSSGHRLLRTLNMILDLSKIESNKEEIYIEEFDVSESVKYCFKLFENNIIAKRLEAKLNLPEKQLIMQTDKRMFDAILNNLINNAVKFTEKGSISISVHELLKGTGRKSIFLEVKDTGIGMTEEAVHVIFEEFRQASEGLSRLHEGAGLGLTITKKYVKLLHGNIKVESRPGMGSTFTVEIPINLPAIAGKHEANEVLQQNNLPEAVSRAELPPIILVDDDEIIHGITKSSLKSIAVTDFASSFASAIEKISAVKYRVVILDVNLKEEKNGIDLLKEIRKMDGYKDTPIIACTAYAMHGDKEKLLEEGFSDYLSKPFSPKILARKVAEFLNSIEM